MCELSEIVYAKTNTRLMDTQILTITIINKSLYMSLHFYPNEAGYVLLSPFCGWGEVEPIAKVMWPGSTIWTQAFVGVLQSNASNWTAFQLIFVHPISKDIQKTIIKCLPGFFGGKGRGQDCGVGWVCQAWCARSKAGRCEAGESRSTELQSRRARSSTSGALLSPRPRSFL